MSQRLKRPLGVALACIAVWVLTAVASLAMENNGAPSFAWALVSVAALVAIVVGIAALGLLAYRLIRD